MFMVRKLDLPSVNSKSLSSTSYTSTSMFTLRMVGLTGLLSDI